MREIDFLSGQNNNEVRPPILEDEYIGDAELLDAYSSAVVRASKTVSPYGSLRLMCNRSDATDADDAAGAVQGLFLRPTVIF